jgi:adenylylsulfate kinase-like enzyme
MIYWFIGQPGCGKTTLAKATVEDMINPPPIYLDGDELRAIFTKKVDGNVFTKEYRIEQTLILQKFVSLLANQKHNVVIATVNPYNDTRNEILKTRSDVRYIYVHTDTPRVRGDYWVKDFEVPSGDYMNRYIDIDTTKNDLTYSIWEVSMKLRKYKV